MRIIAPTEAVGLQDCDAMQGQTSDRLDRLFITKVAPTLNRATRLRGAMAGSCAPDAGVFADVAMIYPLAKLFKAPKVKLCGCQSGSHTFPALKM